MYSLRFNSVIISQARYQNPQLCGLYTRTSHQLGTVTAGITLQNRRWNGRFTESGLS